MVVVPPVIWYDALKWGIKDLKGKSLESKILRLTRLFAARWGLQDQILSK
jgi:hypothetical protein